METMKICVIDEPLNLNVLRELVPCVSDTITIIQRENAEEEMYRISHGTLCTALLIEALMKYKILGQVKITHYSIAGDGGEKAFPAIIEALEYCAGHEINLVSMSVGMVSQARTKDMLPVLERLNHTVVVAAASNRFALTYPAAMPQVIGAKRAMRRQDDEIDRISNPIDGIDIVADLPETDVMKLFYERCNIAYRKSNSELVPQLCARIAAKALQEGEMLTKNYALDCLQALPRASITDDYSHIYPLNGDAQVPAVILPYDGNAKEAFNLAQVLQKEFEKNDYSCAVLSEEVENSDFVQGWYQLDAINQKRCFNYYQNAITEGILLVLVQNNRVQGFGGDLIMKNWCDKILCGNTADLYLTILRNFL